MLSCFHTIPACHGQTDRRTDGRTELLYQYRASVHVLTRDKNLQNRIVIVQRKITIRTEYSNS